MMTILKICCKYSVIWVRFLIAWIFTILISMIACMLACVLGPTYVWVLMARFWAHTTLMLLGIRLHIVGAENLRGPALFISNHQSLIDVVFLPGIVPRTTRIVAKRQLIWIPFWGWMFAAGGAILIDRKHAKEAMHRMIDGLKKLRPGWSVLIFPEGTRSVDGQLRRFKQGAFYLALHAKLPMVPIGIDGARDIVPKEGFLVRSGEVRLVIGKPIDTQSWTHATLQAHVEEGRNAVQACVDAAIACAVHKS